MDFKNSIHIIVLDFFGLFWTILKLNQQQLYVIGPIGRRVFSGKYGIMGSYRFIYLLF